MALYFFHVMDGVALIDTEGTECSGLAEVRQQAIRATGMMLSDLDHEIWATGRTWTMSVADDQGKVVLSLRFSADNHGN